MGRSKRKTESEMLTEVELEIMGHVWRLKECSVHDLLASLPEGRDLAYTSVSTMVRILEKKGFVEARKQGRTHYYSAKIGRREYQARNLRALIGGLFQGSPAALVRRLVDSEQISAEELSALAKMVEDDGAEGEDGGPASC